MPTNNVRGFHGKNGKVRLDGENVEYDVTNWTFNPVTAVVKANTTRTAGFRGGVAGVRDSSGTVEGFLPAVGNVPIHDGDQVTLRLSSSSADYIEVVGIVSSLNLGCNLDGDEMVPYSFDFEGVSEWTGHGAYENTPGASSAA